jgi:hypothetical protein
MAVKPLKDLLKEADQFSTSLSKSASAAPAGSDDIASFAESLMGAESITPGDGGFEKVALAMNRAEALLQIETLQKIAAFEDHANKAGFSKEQVDEAVEKIAAKKLRDNLSVLMAVEGGVMPGPNKNSLVKKKVPAGDIGQAPHEVQPIKSLGYGI